jgi:hypothetical protein
MEALSEFLFDPRRLADIGLTEEELLADLMWPETVVPRSGEGTSPARRAEGKS